jgi:hypothetical protein
VKAGTCPGVTKISKNEGRSAPFPDKEASSRRPTIAKGFYSLGRNRYERDQPRATLRERNRNEHRVHKGHVACAREPTDRLQMDGRCRDGAYCNGGDKSGGLVRESERGKALWL